MGCIFSFLQYPLKHKSFHFDQVQCIFSFVVCVFDTRPEKVVSNFFKTFFIYLRVREEESKRDYTEGREKQTLR